MDHDAEQPHEASGDAGKTVSPDVLTGPHGWINWFCERSGLPRRTERHPDAGVVRPIWEEFALYTDCDLDGHIDEGPYEVFTIRQSAARMGHAEKRLLLRMWDHVPDEAPSRDVEWSTSVDVYFGGDLGDELAALLGLALGRRVRSGGSVRQGLPLADVDQPLGYPMEEMHAAPALEPPRRAPVLPTVADRASLADAVDLFGTYPVLSASDAVALLRAARQYVDALWLADADPRLSWLKLVGALEAAATHLDDVSYETPVEQLKRHRKRLYNLLKDAPPEVITGVAAEIASTFYPERKLKSFVKRFDPGPPPDRPDARGWQFDWSTLDTALSVIYEHRSNDLHKGIAFPLPLCLPPFKPDSGAAAENFSGAVGGHGGRWTDDELPFCLHVFAHVVRGALCNWWTSLATSHDEPTGAPIRLSPAQTSRESTRTEP